MYQVIECPKCWKRELLCVRKAIWSVMVVSVTCRRTLNPGWCLFWACVTAQSEALVHDDTFLRSPSSHWIGRSLTNQAVQPGASQSGFLWTTTPARRTSLLTSSLPLISRVSGGPRQGCPLCPILFDWPGCGLPVRVDQKWRQGGGVCMCGVSICCATDVSVVVVLFFLLAFRTSFMVGRLFHKKWS